MSSVQRKTIIFSWNSYWGRCTLKNLKSKVLCRNAVIFTANSTADSSPKSYLMIFGITTGFYGKRKTSAHLLHMRKTVLSWTRYLKTYKSRAIWRGDKNFTVLELNEISVNNILIKSRKMKIFIAIACIYVICTGEFWQIFEYLNLVQLFGELFI